MLTYTPAELLALSGDRRPPQRAVRKKLFTFRLWRPARQRVRPRRGLTTTMPTTCSSTTRSADLSGDTAIAIGWLNAQSLRNKADTVKCGIIERSLDVLAVTETWHTASDDYCLR